MGIGAFTRGAHGEAGSGRRSPARRRRRSRPPAAADHGIGVVRLRPVFIAVTPGSSPGPSLFLLGSARSRAVRKASSFRRRCSWETARAHYELALALLVAAIARARRSRADVSASRSRRRARDRPLRPRSACPRGGSARSSRRRPRRRRWQAGSASSSPASRTRGLRAVPLLPSLRRRPARRAAPASGALAGASSSPVFWAADRLGSTAGVASGRLDPLLAALLLLAVLALGGDGTAPGCARPRPGLRRLRRAPRLRRPPARRGPEARRRGARPNASAAPSPSTVSTSRSSRARSRR